jgi:ribonuclease HI
MLSIYTDGGCSPNPGRGRFAFAAIKDNLLFYKYQSTVSNKETTNNRCECLAIIYALKWLHQNNISKAVIYTDSMIYKTHYSYMLINCKINKKKKTKNIDLLEIMFSLASESYQIQWVKGHAGNYWNEYVDKLVAIP